MRMRDRIFATVAICNAAVLLWAMFAMIPTSATGQDVPAIYDRMVAVSGTALLLTGLCYLLTLLWEGER